MLEDSTQNSDAILSLLSKTNLFKGINISRLKELLPFLQMQSVQPGAFIVNAGDIADAIYIIQTGTVEVLDLDEENNTFYRLAVLKPAETFGEMGVIDRKPRSISVRALEPVVLVCLSGENFGEIEKKFPKIYLAMLKSILTSINDRLRDTNKIAIDALKRELEQVRQWAKRSIKKTQDRLILITDALPILISSLDTDLNLSFISKSYEEWFQRPRTSMYGKSIKELIGESAYEVFYENYQKTVAIKKLHYFEISIYYQGKDLRYLSAALIPYIQNSEIQEFFLLMSDITLHKQTEEQLSYMATHDALTGLPNRIYFNKYLDQAIERASQKNSNLALLFIDLDHFKTVNDTLGHDVGDLLLCTAASELKRHVRESDIVVRMGGDEFVIVLEKVSGKIVEEIASQICKGLAEEFNIKGHKVNISASIGISMFEGKNLDKETVIKQADIAMYHVKTSTRNNYQFYHQLIDEVKPEEFCSRLMESPKDKKYE